MVANAVKLLRGVDSFAQQQHVLRRGGRRSNDAIPLIDTPTAPALERPFRSGNSDNIYVPATAGFFAMNSAKGGFVQARDSRAAIAYISSSARCASRITSLACVNCSSAVPVM
jgi:hypothetical protein